MLDLQIHDVHLHSIKPSDSAKIILSDADHLLRRFGQAEIRTLSAAIQTDFTQRLAADELWAVISGAASFVLIDQRVKSPTFKKLDTLSISEDDNLALLIPFGVAYALESHQGSQLLRLATHADGTHSGDQRPSRQSFADRLAKS